EYLLSTGSINAFFYEEKIRNTFSRQNCFSNGLNSTCASGLFQYVGECRETRIRITVSIEGFTHFRGNPYSQVKKPRNFRQPVFETVKRVAATFFHQFSAF